MVVECWVPRDIRRLDSYAAKEDWVTLWFPGLFNGESVAIYSATKNLYLRPREVK
jgi:hypothetical protein